MILVTLGTQDKKFTRLLEAVQKQIDLGIIKERIVVQAGCTDFKSKDMEIFDLIPMEDFDKLIKECDILITHGGVGSIITGLKNNKKVIAAARLSEFKEHTNDHQLQIIENFSNAGYILSLDNFDELGDIIKNIKNFKPKKYKSNTDNFNKLIKEKIDFYIKKKINSKKIINALFFISISLYTLFSCYKSIFKPVNIVESENRYANKYEKISVNGFLEGKMQDNFEDTLSDQIVFSSKLKGINNYFNAVMIGTTFKKLSMENKLNYYFYGGIAMYGENNLVYEPYKLGEKIKELDIKINSLNQLMKKYNKVDYYFYYIEKDTDINFTTNTKLEAYEYLKENLNSKNISKFEINNFEEFKDYFYETDHHWNYKGSYKGYTEVLSLLGLDKPKKHGDIICLNNQFIGSKGTGFGRLYKEQFCAYEFNYNDIYTLVDGKEMDYGTQNEYSDNEKNDATYGSFYGGDNGEVIFDTGKKYKENILIIGESFDNAILKLLAEKFNKTISIDLRNYEHFMNKKFDYKKYLTEYKIDKVLFIGNINFWLSEDFIIEE